MGWSLNIIIGDLDAIFEDEAIFAEGHKKRLYNIQYTGSPYPRVMIDHEGELHPGVMRRICALFPDFVYVDFHPNTTFGSGTRTGLIGAI